MNPILMAIILVTVIGLIGAVILVAASIFMYVPVDERVEKITGVLAGANCGACGCAGCADYAKSIVEDGNAINKCTPGGAKSVAAIAEIMGVEATASEPMKAVVTCSGTCDKTSKRYEFDGIHSCQAVKGLYGGDGLCKFGCLGYGDCTRACAFDAIHIVDGIAKVDREKCTGCGACAAVCPNSVISIIPEHKRKPVVLCQNKDKGALTRKACTAGCIGCMKCAKACPKEAITVENNVAYIDQSKCVGCQLCVKECPVGVIPVPANMSPCPSGAPARSGGWEHNGGRHLPPASFAFPPHGDGIDPTKWDPVLSLTRQAAGEGTGSLDVSAPQSGGGGYRTRSSGSLGVVLQRLLDGLLGQDRAVQLVGWQSFQRFRNRLVGQSHGLRDRLSLDELGGHGAGSDGAGTAERLELDV